MFNSPVLDVAIGLVFVFLLYSLLATSIKEAIATLFSLRASMLKQGIINSMLSDTSKDNKLESVVKGIWKLIRAVPYLMGLIPKKKEEEKNIGDKFYDHPLIKNYGASRIYPHPSYIPPENFSTVLIDVLKDDFGSRIDDIVAAKQILLPNETIASIKTSLENSSAVVKIKELLDYYQSFYRNGKTAPGAKVCKETCKILLMHLKNSVYNLEDFSKKLEGWFDDTMDRVSGWYKRQVQLILFIIGLVMAIMFNVDTIQIADKLTTDKDARDKIVQLAMKASDQYKDDPRIKKTITPSGIVMDNPGDSNVFKLYQSKLDSIKKELQGNIDTANNLLAIGWGEYGSNEPSFLKTLLNKTWIGFFYIDDSKEIMQRVNNDTAAFYRYQCLNYPVHVKTAYIWYEVTHKKKKLLGFLILAFAVSLGAPFWFDLLSKIIKLRGSGKQESTNDDNDKVQSTNNQPTNITVNTQKAGDEAVG